MIVSLPLMSLVLVLGLTGLGWWLAQVNSLARKFGATMVILILGLLLANVTSWTPEPSATSWVYGPLTSFAIADLLLAVELRSVLPDARRWFRWLWLHVWLSLRLQWVGQALLWLWQEALSDPISFCRQWQSASWDICLVLLSAWRCPPLLNGLIA